MDIGSYQMPKLLLNESIYSESGQLRVDENGSGQTRFGSNHHWLYNKLCIFNPVHVHQSLFSKCSTENGKREPKTFSYLRFIDLSPGEQYNLYYSLFYRLLRVSSEFNRALAMAKYNVIWKTTDTPYLDKCDLILDPIKTTYFNSYESSLPSVWSDLIFMKHSNSIFGHSDVIIHHTPETVEHRLIRGKHSKMIEEFPHMPKPPVTLPCQPCTIPNFLYSMCPPKVAAPGRLSYAHCTLSVRRNYDHTHCSSQEGKEIIKFGSSRIANEFQQCPQGYKHLRHNPLQFGGIIGTRPYHGWSNVVVPDKQTLISDAGKLFVLDGLLTRLKEEGHRVLIYSQMTKMIDLLEEYMWHRKHTFMRLDGSSKIHERRDMVFDFQQRSDIFVFLLSTRAGGLGINLTAADTVSMTNCKQWREICLIPPS